MVQTRGNLAIREREKQQSSHSQQYNQKTTVVTRRAELPGREKLLYLASVLVAVALCSIVAWRYVHIYDLNHQIAAAQSQTNQINKDIAQAARDEQVLRQAIVPTALSFGLVQATEHEPIFVNRNSGEDKQSPGADTDN
ncbi:hypothetical protein [Saccharibacillus kuerlensis]|uniref:Cell division protein FtsL n=1 Tax=Saccharibacillus kuerlensis TaxID=459527 RepID=A0ABQ2KYQ3_9BACL|nr:hypothetical protein [Saccharibacillus kuerlensis]GGN96521.1 hypothetical protein GCM10010969_13670 [Saccharibacillus kuerlensis]